MLSFGSKEPDIRANLRTWLSDNKLESKIEWPAGNGRIDIYLQNRRVIIEVKARGKLDKGVDKCTGGNTDESAFDQLQRYVKIESSRERLYLEGDADKDLPWIGVITDGAKWWVWEIKNGIFTETEWQGSILTDVMGKQLLEKFKRNKVGREWAPENIKDLFEIDLVKLKELYAREKALTGTKTKQKLWYQQLEISGNAPAEADKDELFVLHCFLMGVSNCIADSIAPSLIGQKQLGFAEWVRSADKSWYKNLEEKTQRYNWKQQSGDILRKLYMELISPAHRKIYGEFYTPDWLAEKLCMEVIDDKFIQSMIKSYHDKDTERILDPACGSGTFLYHAIKRVLNSKPVVDSGMNPAELTNMLVWSVCGIDIHPVAVYMARTSILRALPTEPTRPIRVWQGDSMQTQRSSKMLTLFEDRDTLVVYSGNDYQIRLPKPFLLQQDIMDRITRLVNTANDGKPFPVGVDAGLVDSDIEMLKETHRTLGKICNEEENSVWAWYILNQVGAFILQHEKVGRIVSNPPWVKMASIQNGFRKEEIISAAKDMSLWVGGKRAPSFDIASLFVDKCMNLYLNMRGLAGWVLPQTALKGSSWDGFHKKYNYNIKELWDLDNLPFPKQAKTCVNIISKPKNIKTFKQKLIKNNGEKILHNESWDNVKTKIVWKKFNKKYSKQQSEYTNKTKSEARMGASFVPSCLVRVQDFSKDNNEIKFNTVPSRFLPWKQLGSFKGIVPKHYIYNVLFGSDLLPYKIKEFKKTIIPFNKNGKNFDKNITNQYWKDANDQYKSHRGKGNNSPKTLIDRLNYGNGLLIQLERKTNHVVIYNKSGTWLCASRINKNDLIEYAFFAIQTKTKEESLYLECILNAESLQSAYQASRKSDRDFVTHFWFTVPIKRYDKSNPDHIKLAKLAERAENVAATVVNLTRKSIRKALILDGVSGEIDEIVCKLMPDHAEKLSREEVMKRV